MSALSSSLSQWERLFQVARDLIRQANLDKPIINDWTFGGGTAMMLQIDHRESHDVDIFLSDPQLLPFLDPRKHDFKFQIHLDDYSGDGTRSLKLVFSDVGEIDFIVAAPLTSSPTKPIEIVGEISNVETIPEIITKKVYYRCSNLKPRDIFDIAASGEQYAKEVAAALRTYPDNVAQALATMEKLNPDFVNQAIAQLAIKERYKSIAEAAIERSKKILLSAQRQPPSSGEAN